MKYTAKNVIERALKLADLKNTKFLDHTELTEYLNDSWKALYQIFINNGDKQFVEEKYLLNSGDSTATEYELPFDLYQIHSLKCKGQLLVRAPANTSSTSGYYEIVNNKLRVYGVSGELLLTYYKNPLFLSFPDETIPLEIEGEIISTNGNKILLDSGAIYDILTSKKLGQITINEGEQYSLGDGFVTDFYEDDNEYYVAYLSYKDTEITRPYPTTAEITLLNDGYYYDSDSKKIYYKGEAISDDEYDTNDLYVSTNGPSALVVTGYRQVEDFDRWPTFISLDGYKMAEYIEGNLFETPLTLKYFDLLAIVDYGLIVTDGTNKYLKNYTPDTILNFPNELYFSLLSYHLAMLFALKQNADTTGLQGAFNDALKTYKNSLSANGGYSRIGNVY